MFTSTEKVALLVIGAIEIVGGLGVVLYSKSKYYQGRIDAMTHVHEKISELARESKKKEKKEEA